jgi:hypothetical protein
MSGIYFPAEIIIFTDILQSIAHTYEALPVAQFVHTEKSFAEQQTIHNLYNHSMLQMWRNRISLIEHEDNLSQLRNRIMLAIHRAHGTSPDFQSIAPFTRY